MGERSEVVAVRMTPDELKRLRAVARWRGVSMSEAIRVWIRRTYLPASSVTPVAPEEKSL